MTKNPKRVAAGKKAWAKKSQAEKAKVVRRLKGSGGGKPSKPKRLSGGRTAKAMTKSKDKRQGVGQWLANWIQVATVVANPMARLYEAANYQPGYKVTKFFRSMASDYMGVNLDANLNYVDFDWRRMIRGYGPPAAGYAFKKTTSYFLKNNRVSLIPKLR